MSWFVSQPLYSSKWPTEILEGLLYFRVVSGRASSPPGLIIPGAGEQDMTVCRAGCSGPVIHVYVCASRKHRAGVDARPGFWVLSERVGERYSMPASGCSHVATRRRVSVEGYYPFFLTPTPTPGPRPLFSLEEKVYRADCFCFG